MREYYKKMGALNTWYSIRSAESKLFMQPSETATQVGLLPAIISPQNTSEANNFKQFFTSLSGKTKTAVFKYLQRQLRSTVKNTADDGAVNYCSATETPTYLSDTKAITLDIYKQWKIPNEDVRGYTESFDKVFNDHLRTQYNALLEELEGICVAQYEALRGNTSAGNTTAMSAQGFTAAATFAPNLQFKQHVKKEFRKLSYIGKLICVGDGYVDDYFDILSQHGADNNNIGIGMNGNITKNFSFFSSAMLDTEMSVVLDPTTVTNQALIWQPGSIQMLEWYKNEGDFRVVNDREITDTITLPIPMLNSMGQKIVVPLKFDLYIRHLNCDDATSGLVVTLRKHYDFWSFPADHFNASDPLNGTNGLQRWTMTAG